MNNARRKLLNGICVLLSISVFLTAIPQTETIVYAAGTGKKLQLGASVLVPAMTRVKQDQDQDEKLRVTTAQTVYYGVSETQSPPAWLAIGYNREGAVQMADVVTLLASDNIETNKTYRGDKNVSYVDSDIRKVLIGNDGAGGYYSSKFNTSEQSAIIARTLEHGDYSNEPDHFCDGIFDNNAPQDKLWLLSTKEADLVGQTYREANEWWWLRSPGFLDKGTAYRVAVVNASEYVDYAGHDCKHTTGGVRPAFNLNLSSIILTSAAEGGKDPGDDGDGTLYEIADYADSEWKLTISDSSRSSFTASADRDAILSQPEGYTSWTVPVTYSGAQTGSDKEHVSAILTDSNGAALYYGYIATNSAESTDGVDVTIPDGLSPGTYKLKIFNEQCNGDKKTDLSSDFHDIELTVMSKVATPTFSPDAGTYTTAQDVTISCATEGASIHYTTDGTEPTASSPAYSNPITVSGTKTIKAIAVKDGMTNSSLAEATYTMPITVISADDLYFVFLAAETYQDTPLVIKLGCDITVYGTNPAMYGGNAVLDLNGKSLTDYLSLSIGEGNLTVRDSGTTGTITFPGSTYDNRIVIDRGGSFTLEGGTIVSGNSGDACVEVRDGTFIMNGGKLEATGENGRSVIVNKDYGSFTQNGGEITGLIDGPHTHNGGTNDTVSVTYHANGGRGTMDVQYVRKNTETPLTANAFTRSGHSFAGWSTASEADPKYADGQKVKLTDDLELYALWSPLPVYNVTMTDDGNGTASADPESGMTNTEVTITAKANDGYGFKKWEVKGGGVTLGSTTSSTTKFKIETADVEIKAHFEKLPPNKYSITVTKDGNGTAKADKSVAEKGEKITLTAAADKDWKFVKWQVVSGGVTISNNSFTMPGNPVEVKAIFEKEAKPEPEPEPEPEPTIQDISKATVSGIKNKTYTGKAITQSPVVKLDGKILKADKDYTVSYKNNKNTGTATVTITGKGSYTGSVTKNFRIKQAANKLNVKAKKDKYSASYSRNKNKTISGSKIYEFTDKKKTHGTIKYTLSTVKKDGKKVTKGFYVNKGNGKLTIKKGVAKGSYKITVKVTAGNKNYKTVKKNVEFTVKIR